MTGAAHVLREAKQIVMRGHHSPGPGPCFLAVNEHGARVRPLSPAAVAWVTAGAICKVAPARSVHDEKTWADNTEAGWEAYELLEQAAGLQGYRTVVDVDREGMSAALRMFAKAQQLVPDERRRRYAPRKGATA